MRRTLNEDKKRKTTEHRVFCVVIRLTKLHAIDQIKKRQYRKKI